MPTQYKVYISHNGTFTQTIYEGSFYSDAAIQFEWYKRHAGLTYPMQLILRQNGKVLSSYVPERRVS